jgi:hypothetical protein
MSITERILRAKNFALAAHGDQKYGGGDLPYEFHLEKCQEVRRRFVTDFDDILDKLGIFESDLIMTLWLHDNREDTAVGDIPDILKIVFGDIVHQLVWAVTDAVITVWECDHCGESGKLEQVRWDNRRKPYCLKCGERISLGNRYDRHWGTVIHPGPYRKIPTVSGACLVKLIDRIANIEASIGAKTKLGGKFANSGLLDMYKKEQPEFYQTLFTPGPLLPLWNHCNKLLDYKPQKE